MDEGAPAPVDKRAVEMAGVRLEEGALAGRNDLADVIDGQARMIVYRNTSIYIKKYAVVLRLGTYIAVYPCSIVLTYS